MCDYDDYDDYVKECEKIEKENETYIELFYEALLEKQLTVKTINRHCNNVAFYLNTYLLREEPKPMKCGCYEIDNYLGNFFIRKCMWSTPSNIKTTSTSIKKFYQCMLEQGKIEKQDYLHLCDTIKGKMKEWQEECAIYNDPDEPNPFFFF